MSTPVEITKDRPNLVEIRGLAVALLANGDIRSREFVRLDSLLDYVEELEYLLDQQWRAALNAQAERDQLRVQVDQLSVPPVMPTWPNGERRRGYPAYEVPPADPLLANPIEKRKPRSWAEEVQEDAADFYGREHSMGDS